MVSMRNLALAASSILSLVSAAPTIESRQDAWTPGTLNNTREFYLHMTVTDGDYTHNGWVCKSQPQSNTESPTQPLNPTPTAKNQSKPIQTIPPSLNPN